MWTRAHITAGLACLAGLGACYDGPESRPVGWGAPQSVLGSTAHESANKSCRVSHVTRYDMARKRGAPVYFSTSPLDDFEWPRIEPMNATAGEQWEFDGISADGTQAFVFGFYRDPNYDILGTGNLRMYAEFVFANGSRYAIVDYAEESIIESCAGLGTRGTWRSDEFSYTFEISADFSSSRVSWENPEARGTVVMTSAAPPRYADNNIWPSEHASTLTVPHFYWTEPVPVAEMALEMVVHGEAMAWKGMGGHERLWGAFNWFTCLSSMTAVRILAGPYALAFVEFGSGRQPGLAVPSMILAKDGVKIFGTRRTEPSDTEDFFLVKKLYGGEGGGVTTEKLADKATGVEVVLESPRRRLRWRFVVTHKNVGFEYVLGEGRGGTAYSGLAEGGEQGSPQQWSGPAFTEIMRFPEKSWLLKSNYLE